MTEPEQPAPTGKGRPRPNEVVERDRAVHAHLHAHVDEAGNRLGKTREEVAQALGLEGKQVYLSFYRLKRDGKVQKGGAGGAQKWTSVAEPETSAEPAVV